MLLREMADEAPPKPLAPRRGVAFRPKALKAVPEEFRNLPVHEDGAAKPSPVTVGARVMFAPRTGAAAAAAAAAGKAAGPADAARTIRRLNAAAARAAKPVAIAKPVPPPRAAQPEGKEAEEEEEEKGKSAAAEELAPPGTEKLAALPEDLRTMADLILEEEAKNLYSAEVPEVFVSDTRRGFANFVQDTYKVFALPAGPIEIPEGEKYYPYQKFVRDYMRRESPYRGVLVYHGLGSGKTCTAIAAAEALFAAGKKKIIVMAPKSLKDNFFKEISFCGFRHFQLKNYWIPLDPADATTALFANQVLGLSGKYLKTARHVWVPDFRKSPAESNYETEALGDADREEIRAQILSILEWDEKRNPTGRIRFISYNGVTVKRLLTWACGGPDKFFDDAVIVIDEIHNLVRNMTGKIEPYMKRIETQKRTSKRVIPVEMMEPKRWRPSICDVETTLYTRGYLFYRLLCDAQNSKIIGLSGTPLINFPHELGVLMNVLHGYLFVGRLRSQRAGEATIQAMKDIAQAHPFIDFVNVAANIGAGGGTKMEFSLLPYGIRKIGHDVGVQRIPPEEPIPSLEDTLASIKKAFIDGGIPLEGEIALSSEPLLPINPEEFQNAFLTKAGDRVENEAVLVKRLTGLVSYYKGSRLELMPRVERDEVVRVPFSLYAQKAYSFRRNQEIETEMKKKSGGEKVDAIMAKIYALGDSAAANNYKMGSRQACNFAFPASVVRPMPGSKGEEAAEAGAGAINVELNTLDIDAPSDGGKQDEAALGPLPAFQPGGEEGEEDAEAAAEQERALEDEFGLGDAGVLEEGGEGGAAAGVKRGGGNSNDEEDEKEGKSAAATVTERALQAVEALTGVGSVPAVAEPGGAAAAAGPAEKPKKGLAMLASAVRAKKPAAAAAPPPAAPKEPEGKEADEEDEEDTTTSTKPGVKEALQRAKAAAAARADLARRLAQERAARAAADEEAERAALPVTCRTNRLPGEEYVEACARAKRCLLEVAKDKMTLGGPDGLANHSAKFAAMLERINAAPGSSLVYSQFLDMEGIGIFRVAMEANGYVPIEIISNPGGGYSFSEKTTASFRSPEAKTIKRYLTFSGGEDQIVRSYALQIFNAKLSELPDAMSKLITEAGFTDNKTGEICRVFCITSAGAEGLSLRNVRAVHLMEPYWNEVRMRQVKGRAIRIGSHLDLPEDQRNVSIYTYISTFSDRAQLDKAGEHRIDESILIHDTVDSVKATEYGLPLKPGQTMYAMTTDEMIYVISERKRKIITALETILKSAAVDCELNYKQNKDGSYTCLPLKGAIGDFLYHPVLDIDIQNAGKYKGAAEEAAGPGLAVARQVAPVAAQEEEGFVQAPDAKLRRLTAQQKDYLERAKAAAARGDAKEEEKMRRMAKETLIQIGALKRSMGAAAPPAEAAAKEEGEEDEKNGAPAAAAAAPKPREFGQTFRGKPYMMREVLGADGKPTGFKMFTIPENQEVGTAGYNPLTGKPTAPVKFIEGYDPSA